MTTPRGLTPEEAAVWERIIATVTPLAGRAALQASDSKARPTEAAAPPVAVVAQPRAAIVPPPTARVRVAPRPLDRDGLDGSWERRLAKAEIAPDLTLDLHGCNLEQAHARLLGGLSQALALGARVVLLITGKPRPHDTLGGEHEPRGGRRGAIRARLLDWLAASPHAARIAAVRTAHPRHGGAGAVYIILRRRP